MKIAVTGATGSLGALVVEHLLARGADAPDVTATGRDTAKLSVLAERGVRAIASDYDDAATLDAAFGGADTLVLVSSSAVGRRVEQHANALRAAERAGVQHVVYTSAPHADTSPLVLAPEHKATEALLVASPIEATVLRNNWYNENYEQAFAQATATGTYLASTGAGKVASAARSDYAEAAAVIASTGRHRGETLELAGGVAWNGEEFAAAASRVTGREVRYASVPAEKYREVLSGAGLDDQVVDFVLALDDDIAHGLLDGPTDVLADVIGHPTMTLEDSFSTWFHRES
ncbi:SDR family oxidoreductase [Curtobacterium sp. VKM Ac-2887]|uniref:SDR family oxidoreductase n=1 Tax=Curtobacterium sp. VKM Ac-2887 TaxID=2783819 RepID=UPI00188AAC5C|nr:SDR family oxidoreductase [Curtobacterium sp. VKM Ac-2887]MBF4588262.1 SDR family oxidoreductase [Curtobacterium sp. VKM Ac-2887]